MRDPKFLWCAQVSGLPRGADRKEGWGVARGQALDSFMLLHPQCSFGFIYEREQLEATCPQCHQTFCVRCKRQVRHV